MSSRVIGIGDTVLISGLLGENKKHLNNKVGVIQKITSISNIETHSNFADVLIDETIFSIEFRNLYKMREMQIDPIFKKYIYNPAQYFFSSYLVRNYTIVIRADGAAVAECTTQFGYNETMTLTSLN